MFIKEISAAVAISLALNLIIQDKLVADPATDWELQHLHNPSDALQEAEHRGQVTIYDGVNIVEVNKALDQQFDRIDSMMFVRTKHPTPDGDFYADDDCD